MVLILLVSLVVVKTVCFVTRTTKTITHEMRLTSGDPFREGKQWISLTFVHFPAYGTSCGAANVQQYLRSLGQETVPVTFAVAYECGKVFSVRVTRIGGFPSVIGSCGSSFDENLDPDHRRSPWY